LAQKDSPGVTPDGIKIGSCSALSGAASFLGTQMVAGAKAYFNLVNAQGGVNGRKLALETEDDEYDPDKAAPCWETLQKTGVFAAAFFVGTPTGVKYIPLAEASHTPLVGLFTGAEALIDPSPHHFQRSRLILRRDSRTGRRLVEAARRT
jgi:ABC-type branched-subunit amino acid transport system substrate-binding protein